MERNNRKFVWAAVAGLIALTAGFAMVAPRKAVFEKPPVVQGAAQAVVVTAEPVAPDVEEPPVAVVSKTVSKTDAEPATPAPRPELRKPSCNCETAETDLPDLCPNAACHQCKAKCGIIAH